MPAGYDAEVAELFRDLRSASGLSEADLAAQLATRPEVVQALEQGALYALPPWPETYRVRGDLRDPAQPRCTAAAAANLCASRGRDRRALPRRQCRTCPSWRRQRALSANSKDGRQRLRLRWRSPSHAAAPAGSAAAKGSPSSAKSASSAAPGANPSIAAAAAASAQSHPQHQPPPQWPPQPKGAPPAASPRGAPAPPRSTPAPQREARAPSPPQQPHSRTAATAADGTARREAATQSPSMECAGEMGRGHPRHSGDCRRALDVARQAWPPWLLRPVWAARRQIVE